jgi:hypothetical protein
MRRQWLARTVETQQNTEVNVGKGTDRLENNINMAFIDEYKVNERERLNYLTNYTGLNLLVLWSVLMFAMKMVPHTK